MSETERIAEIAKGLKRHQVAVLLSSDFRLGNGSSSGMVRIALINRGLGIYKPVTALENEFSLTPLGQQVRAYLETTP